MRRLAALALALLTLAPACQEEPGQQPPDDRPRGERCDDMQMCGRVDCAAEIQALSDCVYVDDLCGEDPSQKLPIQEALAQCLVDNDCNTTSCDLVGAFTREGGESAEYCEVEDDGELLDLAFNAMLHGDQVAECQALE